MIDRKCSRCHAFEPIRDSSHKSGYGFYCRECNNARRREWSAKNKERVRELARESRTEWCGFKYETAITRTTHGTRQSRERGLDAYGGKCECCGETRREFLTIDHIHGGGQRHRKTLTDYFFRWLARE